MKYNLDLPASLVERIYDTVGDREGFSLRTFILLAIENQLEMETGESELEGEAGPAPTKNRAQPEEPELSGDVVELITGGGEQHVHAPAVRPEQRSDTTDAHGTPWLWGQVNRLLPVKFVVRVLANSTGEGGLPFSEAQTVVGEAGREFGLYLRRLDDQAGRGRVDRLSVGFPTADSKEDAVSRFRTHFLGQRREDGRVAGAPFTLGLVGLLGDGEVALTEAGGAFARLANPILDGQRSGEATLSEEESGWYLQHCRHEVPGEAKAFAIILEAVSEPGGRSNDELDSVIAENAGSDWSETMVTTQRSGTMGRMLELGLTERHREGRRVRFSATERGRKFLGEYRKTD